MRSSPPILFSLSFSVAIACGDDTIPPAGGTAGSTASGDASGSTTDIAPGDGTNAGDSTAGPTMSTGEGTTAIADATTSTPGDDDASGSSGTRICSDVGDPCTICESTTCPAEYCGCYDNGSCLLLAQCVAGCAVDDTACAQACWTQYPDGISDGALLTHCAATLCAEACGRYVPLTPCQLCLYTECAEAMNVCIANPECTALLQCLDACEAPGCENTCYIAHPDGLADSGPVGRCAQEACVTQCA